MRNSVSPLEKAIRILELLKEYSWTPASSLAKDLKVSVRTVFRLLKQIDLAFGGYPVFESSSSGYRLARKVLKDVWQGRDDAVIAAAILTSPYSRGLKESPNRLDRFLGALQSRIRIENEIPTSLLQPILKCFMENRICSIEYKLNLTILAFDVFPLRLVSEHGIHYLQVQDISSVSIKLLAIDKIKKITVGHRYLYIHEIKKLLDFIDSAWGIMVTGKIQSISFEVDEDIKPYFERNKLHWSQEVHKREAHLLISVMIHNQEEFMRWIYRFGSHVSNITLSNKKGDISMSNRNIGKSQILKKIHEQSKKIGLFIDDKGYLDTLEKNLIMPFSNFAEICEELGEGQGSELVAKGKSKPKFYAVHSSACLCVNSFALLKQYCGQLEFFGYKEFNRIQFEKKLSTGISSPNLDFYLENSDTIIGVESKFTELLTPKLPNAKRNKGSIGNLTKYINRQSELITLPENFKKDILKTYIDAKEKFFLDVAQLIKHTLGLLAQSKEKPNKKPVLVYLYWTPINAADLDIYRQHEKEVEDFSSKISKYIEFHYSSYLSVWNNYANNSLYKDCVAALQRRYSIDV